MRIIIIHSNYFYSFHKKKVLMFIREQTQTDCSWKVDAVNTLCYVERERERREKKKCKILNEFIFKYMTCLDFIILSTPFSHKGVQREIYYYSCIISLNKSTLGLGTGACTCTFVLCQVYNIHRKPVQFVCVCVYTILQ